MAVEYRQGVLYPSDVKELEEAFCMFTDKDGSRIPSDRIGKVLQAFGQNPTKATIKECIKKYDPTGRGYIEEKEYKELLSEYTVDQDILKEDLQKAFKKFTKIHPKNGKETLNMGQLKQILTVCGEPLTQEEIEEFMNIIDDNHDGVIDSAEYVNYFLSRV